MPSQIPNYALYGDSAAPAWLNSFDFEWIPQRSRPYNWHILPHTHDAFVQILHLTAGEVEVVMDGQRSHLRAPCLLVIPARTVHGFTFSSDVDGPVVTAAQRPLESLASLAMPELVAAVRRPALLPLRADDRHVQALMPLFLAIEREARTHAVGQMAAGMSLLTALMVQVSRLAPLAAALTPTQPASRKSGQVERFRALVDRHFREHRTVSDYASELGITAGQLSRLCRELLGMSALDLINARLVHEAQRDLVYTASSIKQLAAQIGFADEAYFGRFFRRHTGLTPREFRVRALAAMAEDAKKNPALA